MTRVRSWLGDKVVEDGFGVGLCTTMHNAYGLLGDCGGLICDGTW